MATRSRRGLPVKSDSAVRFVGLLAVKFDSAVEFEGGDLRRSCGLPVQLQGAGVSSPVLQLAGKSASVRGFQTVCNQGNRVPVRGPLCACRCR